MKSESGHDPPPPAQVAARVRIGFPAQSWIQFSMPEFPVRIGRDPKYLWCTLVFIADAERA
ncbi:hypothetical protein F3Y22_tig00110710pilonHSYRG00019 [Hibiscus syriacus]|uniref:Uncharacterized protein n=1 Tax=Hibiscus syriacus TaxID=106335 RepID=A0A6A2ZWD5_HIBSY|nr:hypothetical protein F3Y22_tig00110710pilonHSYRG00019 [Hibiscus syriacus]